MIAVPSPVVEVRRDCPRDCPLNDLFLALRRFESFFDCVVIVNDISLYSFAQEVTAPQVFGKYPKPSVTSSNTVPWANLRRGYSTSGRLAGLVRFIKSPFRVAQESSWRSNEGSITLSATIETTAWSTNTLQS